MKTLKTFPLLVICFFLFALAGCTKKKESLPEPDQRDLHTGRYVCEVTKTNFSTKVLLASFQDTVEVVKHGPDRVRIETAKKMELPELKILSPYAYVGLATIASFQTGQIVLTHGLDSAFYEYRGVKLP